MDKSIYVIKNRFAKAIFLLHIGKIIHSNNNILFEKVAKI